MAKALDSKIVSQILDMYYNNHSGYEIAKTVGCNYKTVYNILRRYNVEARPKGRIPTEMEQKIVRLYTNQKLSCKKVAEAVGTNVATVFNVLKRNNIETRTKGGIEELPLNELVKRYKEGASICALAKEYDVTDHTICNYLEKAGVSRDNLYHNLTLDRTYFSVIDTYDKAYFLGLMYTDGNVGRYTNSVNITLEVQDAYLLRLFNDKIHNENPLSISKRMTRKGKDSITAVAHFKSEDVKVDLIHLQVVPNKTYEYTEKPPAIREDLEHHFIRGLIEGDGSICGRSTKKHYVFFCGNETIVNYVHDVFVNKLGVTNTKVSQPQRVLWSVQWNNLEDFLKICEYLYADKRDCYMIRKYRNYAEIKEKYENDNRENQKVYVNTEVIN